MWPPGFLVKVNKKKVHSSVKCPKKVDLNQCLNRGEWIICLCLESDERDWRETERERKRERQKDTERETERQRKAQRELCLAVVTRYTFNFLT